MPLQQCQSCYIFRISKAFCYWKNEKLKVLVLLNVMKLLYEIYIPFQWCPLCCMIVKKGAVKWEEEDMSQIKQTLTRRNCSFKQGSLTKGEGSV
jgi:hypothetical protein